MKGYDPKTPRIPMALAAAVMTALTMSLLVLAPASAEIEGPATYLACRTGSATCAEASNAATSAVLGVPPAGTSSTMRPSRTTTPRAASSAKMPMGSLIQIAGCCAMMEKSCK